VTTEVLGRLGIAQQSLPDCAYVSLKDRGKSAGKNLPPECFSGALCAKTDLFGPALESLELSMFYECPDVTG
jgi:hypothetical protein